ncbi:DUF1871 family protein [Neobacillus ginsengisoli]|uniref:DUF1871 family protein n=1 Tax=Neobacillus ginsengisoli TaxID=904295 RepID=A0ABT9XVB6_9BACI|nr:DUF1871 family protein [Neobacillus ginsengisoli]MDQ0198837.1 hypothetical protein [Neobacillus ginsengisoli]
MNSQLQTNLQFVDLLNEWDPFHLETGGYDTEIADTIQAVHVLNDSFLLAKRIQEIYEFSFEKIIPMESCLEISRKLLLIKDSGTCSL